MNRPTDIPSNCYECQIAPTCKALPRWGTKATLNEYYWRRHENCPYTALLKMIEQTERSE